MFSGGDFKSSKPVDFTKGFPANSFLVLCYHDIPVKIADDKDGYAVELESFVRQLEFLKSQGCSFIGTDDILKAKTGEKKLPEKAVLISFDDAYESFYRHVFPLLKLYKCPAVLAVVSSWIDTPPDEPEYNKTFMSWEQLREVASSGLVKIASHSHAQHRGVLMNPLGSIAPAIQTRTYFPDLKRYETKDEYLKRISGDLGKSSSLIREKTGIAPEILVWPYGRYNHAGIEEAQKAGFKFMFTLDDGFATPDRTEAIPRFMIMNNPSIENFAEMFQRKFINTERLRIVHADIDSVYDPDPEKLSKNIDAFIERIFSLKPSAVYLQAFCDDKGDGNVSSVYFNNRVLPVKADIFSRIARSIFIRGIMVYAWMPAMTYVLPDENENERLRVCEFRNGKIQPSTSWYKRLSPFNEEACRKIEMIFEDLAAHCDFDGVIFQDDAYMNDYEDFSPDALREYAKISGDASIPFDKLNGDQKNKWTDLKTEKIMSLTDRIKKKVLYYRPEIRFARTLYAPVLLKPESEEWFCQNYAQTLKRYDYAVIMAYPRMEDIFWETRWLKSLVKKASEHPDGLNRTVFKTQAFDWEKDKWIDSDTVNGWLRILAAAGAHHIAYYPDDYIGNRPDARIISDMISSKYFPFDKK
ncbi:MAG: poly-beta-1,6-N-acetyl-D-glucosamine N-deacetylase PgaB [Lentisphaerae bacterium GWF2_49_21]|nr:MAG: poly-beta-1,6-N-acetyl-D-glucosamine N-deacetylase PgaB [Lentisphaerae bacterium GWF2_49_21]